MSKSIHVEHNSNGSVAFSEALKRIDGEWDKRWIWTVHENPLGRVIKWNQNWEGFKTIDECIADYNKTIVSERQIVST